MLDSLSDEYDREELAAFIFLLANAKRLAILEILIQGEISVTELAKRLDISQSSLSQHLLPLRLHKIVNIRRDAQFVYYRCDSHQVRYLLDTIHDIWPEISKLKR
ncbi:ArsR/SmtB family transcription factor [Rhizobium sp. AG207R]|uniref:ArsR/SmtB family transcription factor n=1 Tax=Rhizobium sp. AG207R TaxID=2802287 RepID=UPI0022AC875D|nr:metalloregulator ArsR/SmtB family transcription factor [Rhizobium sp. AG207R]MCZ3374318.1 winged helix-turn-helix transcriptional regulator [Rhizobium sp. AG207R]